MRRPRPADALVAAGVVGLLAAFGARRPVLRRWPVSILQAVPCTPASEAPRPLLATFAALTLFAVSRGAVTGAIVNGATVAALAGLTGDAARSATALDRALDEVGGPTGWAAVNGSAVGAAPGSLPGSDGTPPGDEAAVGRSSRPLFGRRARRRHLRAADLAYGSHLQQRLDVWAAADAGPGAPVLVQVHGGGWTTGDKRVSASPLMAHLVERGWVCATVNYRLAPAHRLPDQIDDVRLALDWVVAHVAEFGGDPGFVAITGGSAGGHLASLAAVTGAPVAAAVSFYGVHDFSVDEHGLNDLLRTTAIGTSFAEDPDLWRSLSPLHRAGPDAPPFLLVHGTTDTIVAVGQSRRFAARLREVSRSPVHYAELPHAQHGFDGLPTARTAHAVRAVHRFLATVHAAHRADRGSDRLPAA